MDSAKNLGMEAVFINHNFTQQVLKMVRSTLRCSSALEQILLERRTLQVSQSESLHLPG